MSTSKMKFLIILGIVTMLANTPTFAETEFHVNDLLTKCESRFESDKLVCRTFLVAVLDTAFAFKFWHQIDKPDLGGICSLNVTIEQMLADMKQIVKEQRANGFDLGKSLAASVLVAALRKRNPCPGNK